MGVFATGCLTALAWILRSFKVAETVVQMDYLVCVAFVDLDFGKHTKRYLKRSAAEDPGEGLLRLATHRYQAITRMAGEGSGLVNRLLVC